MEDINGDRVGQEDAFNTAYLPTSCLPRSLTRQQIIESALAHYDQDFREKGNLSIAIHCVREDLVKFYQAPYRGNIAFERRVLNTFANIKKALYWAGSQNYLDLAIKKALTRCLHVVLEFDSNRFDLSSAWCSIPKFSNNFLTAFKKRYGRILYFRKVEAHESGYPHVHYFIYCYDHEFHTFWLNGKLFIKETKHNPMNPSDLAIEDLWTNGYIRVEGSTNLIAGVNYLASSYFSKSLNYRDLLKDRSDPDKKKGILTLALTHHFGMNLFSYSHNVKALVDLHQQTLNENNALHSSNSISPTSSDYVFLGIVKLHIPLESDKYSIKYSEFWAEEGHLFTILYGGRNDASQGSLDYGVEEFGY